MSQNSQLFDWSEKIGDKESVEPIIGRMEKEAMEFRRRSVEALSKVEKGGRPKSLVRVSLDEAKALAGCSDDSVMERVLAIKAVRIASWDGGKSNLFWWQACMDRLADGAVWSVLLDRYHSRGWPEEELIGEISRSSGKIYSLDRPGEISRKLETWAENLGEAEIEKLFERIVGGPSFILDVVAKYATCLTERVLEKISGHVARLETLVLKNQNLNEGNAAYVWRAVADANLGISRKESPVSLDTEYERDMRRVGWLLQERGIMPAKETEELFWEWLRSGDEPADRRGLAVFAFDFLTHPKTRRTQREMEELGKRAWAGVNINRILNHSALDISGVEEILLRSTKLGMPSFIMENLVTEERIERSQKIRDFVIEHTEHNMMGRIVGRIPPEHRGVIVSKWAEREPRACLKWMKQASDRDLAGIDQSVLGAGFLSGRKEDRLDAIKLGSRIAAAKKRPRY